MLIKKLSIYLIILNICIVGFTLTISHLIKLKESRIFLQSYMQSSINIDQIIFTEDLELIKKALQVSNGETNTVVKLSKGLTDSTILLFVLSATLFFILFSINLYFTIKLIMKS
jgi:hypothetical protein